jgi:hypothetical protein
MFQKKIIMIKPLRKRHVQIWFALAVFIPLGIVSAWLVVPKPVQDHLLNPVHSDALPVIIKTVSTDDFTASLRKKEDGSAFQLEWNNHSPLTVPSAIIYETHPGKDRNETEGAALIGRIDYRGLYHFSLEKDSANEHRNFMLYDIIHHRVIHRIIF